MGIEGSFPGTDGRAKEPFTGTHGRLPLSSESLSLGSVPSGDETDSPSDFAFCLLDCLKVPPPLNPNPRNKGLFPFHKRTVHICNRPSIPINGEFRTRKRLLNCNLYPYAALLNGHTYPAGDRPRHAERVVHVGARDKRLFPFHKRTVKPAVCINKRRVSISKRPSIPVNGSLKRPYIPGKKTYVPVNVPLSARAGPGRSEMVVHVGYVRLEA